MNKTNRTFALTALSAAMTAILGANASAAEDGLIQLTENEETTQIAAADEAVQIAANDETAKAAGEKEAGQSEEDDELARLTKPSSSISVGVGKWSGDREQFGIYDDIRDGETKLLLDGDINERDDATGTWITGKFRNLGIEDRSAEMGYERQGNWGVGVDYSEIPHMAPYTVNTGMSGINGTTQSVPDSNSGYVPGTGSDEVLGTKRKRAGVEFYKFLTPNLKFNVNFKNEEKDGNRHWGRGGQPEFAAEPIDSDTNQLETVLEYAGKKLQLTGGYYGSWYDNHNDLVTTYRGDGSEYYLSLPLDNEAHQFFLNGGYNFTPTTRATLRVSYTHATQDENIPTADIPGLADPGAPTNLDGELNTTHLQLGLTARPLQNLSLVANLRYHKVDEQTPAWLVVTGNTEVHSTPLDYKTISGKLEGTYRLPAGYSLIGGIDYSEQDRKVPYGSDRDGDGLDDERYVPFRKHLDETVYRLQVRKSLSETLNGSLAFLHSKRDGSNYSEAVHSEGNINPVNIADRDRNRWRLSMDWTPTNQLGLQLNVEDSDDDYGPDGPEDYGLTDGSARLYSLDADYAINQDWHLVAWASYDETKAKQFNGRWDRQTENHELDRKSHLKDTGKSLGLGITGQATRKLKVGADVQWTRTESQYDDNVIPIGENGDPDIGYPSDVTPLPDIENTATKFSLFAEYAMTKRSELRLDLAYERWKTDDWTWEFSDGSPFIYGTTNDGTQIDTDDNQSATFVGLRYRYRF